MSAFQSNEENKSRGVALRRKIDPSNKLTSRLQRQAQDRAAEAARRVPWQVLLEARNQYLEWQEFYYWVRSILECEERVPDWLARRLNEMCPGFLNSEALHTSTRRRDWNGATCAIQLGAWIDKHVFAFSREGGWLPAITFYAVREPRYGKVSAHWSECVKNWRQTKPPAYPSFEEWLRGAQQCDETAHLLPEVRKQRECFKLVRPERLREAVARYIDWEALAYWARPALERKPPVLTQVACELDARCPGFSDFNDRAGGGPEALPQGWARLMLWIGDYFFSDAKAEGWYDAILVSVRIHPRAIRTMEYSDHCDEVWNGELPVPYTSFEVWRRDADRYVDVTDI
jgi:hypothetical protein